MSTTRTYSHQVSKLILHFNFRLKKELSLPSSPVPHLLNSNSPPSDDERQKVARVLSVAKKRANKLEERLGRKTGLPNSTRLQVLRTLEKMESFILIHESVLSTFRILPNEILALIFISCLPDVESEPWHQRKWQTLPSFRLSQVCGRWRDLAINTPQLWTILGDVVVNPKTAESSHNTYLNFLEELLRRSREMDLWVFISTPVTDYSPNQHSVIDALMKHELRWAALGIYGGPFAIKVICDPTRPTPASFARLRKLYLNVIWHLVSDISVIKMTRAPLLTEVMLPNLLHDKVLLPFNKLRVYREKLSGHHVSRKHSLVQALTNGKNLEALDILAKKHLSCSDQLSATTIVLDRLTTLSLLMDTVSSTAQLSKSFLNTLSLPCLEELRVAGFGEYQSPFVTSFIQHAVPRGIGSTLRKLYIRNMTFRKGALSKLLEITPNLEELNVDFPHDEDLDNLITGRAAGDESSTPSLVSKLKGLVLYLSQNINPGRATFLDKHKNTFSVLAGALVDKEVERQGLDSRNPVGKRITPYFRLVLSDAPAARALQVELNFQNYNMPAHSSEPANPDSEENMGLRDRFFSWRARLHQALPELAKGEILTTTTYFNTGFPSDFDDLLREIERVKLSTGRQVANLYVTGLHLTLSYLSNAGDGYIPGDSIYTFRSRAKRILRNWDQIILADLKSRKIQWALKGPRSLMYVGHNDEWHNSLAIRNAVYFGLKDNDSEDLIWPDNIV